MQLHRAARAATQTTRRHRRECAHAVPESNQSLEIELDPAATLRAVRDDTMQTRVNRLERLERDRLQRWGQGGGVHADTLPQCACGDPVGISYSIGNLIPLYELRNL